ncbi:hypothetical protein WN66_05778 [Saccharomyces cerevisiae]|uniref:Putative uncharacterized protein YOL035C n=2 Tax=Saccharomyces cerevisiae TaxID=4932 RepID=YO035_YEAST|nr:RecName: Full=Putative uncharacterized protein YOL035C [Saccharomyces cerevisiae S288C]AAS56753.1 YOL035C [Saccharomyces cerevisiae]KZV07848.1 hypothetical protein WN66_05778 [Saccharomyces cerevisiae]CAA99039.1 unnamed protein product [Saccharomyces cerevisiae]CAY86254.1 EC1118_1O4_1464p [Saccharomyces cerevisiae EC1118]
MRVYHHIYVYTYILSAVIYSQDLFPSWVVQLSTVKSDIIRPYLIHGNSFLFQILQVLITAPSTRCKFSFQNSIPFIFLALLLSQDFHVFLGIELHAFFVS